MRIGIVTPAPPRSRYGNRVTALRWARILRGLGHRVSILQEYDSEGFDLLIALHARRSHQSIKRFERKHPDRTTIVALTGTDLYRDLGKNKHAEQSLQLATRIIVLQPKACNELNARFRQKVRLIYQSVQTRSPRKRRESSSSSRAFEVCVIGHLRTVKDPFRAAMAARLLPSWSRIRVTQLGGAMTVLMATYAHEEMKTNARYRWLGELPQWRVRQVLSLCRACVVSSKMEGGANILSEAVVAGVPLLASRIPGNVGILGDDYPGYFKIGDTGGLAQLLLRAETDARFLKSLRQHCANLAPLFKPSREKAAWASLLRELFQHGKDRES
ncbi:MAG: selenoneine biosynthesis selenosugar synthase SenB [Pyrinomonadaceae bacterium]